MYLIDREKRVWLSATFFCLQCGWETYTRMLGNALFSGECSLFGRILAFRESAPFSGECSLLGQREDTLGITAGYGSVAVSGHMLSREAMSPRGASRWDDWQLMTKIPFFLDHISQCYWSKTARRLNNVLIKTICLRSPFSVKFRPDIGILVS